MLFYIATFAIYAAVTIFGPLVGLGIYESLSDWMQKRRVRREAHLTPTEKRLGHIAIATALCREYQDAYHEEACDLLHVDPNVPSVERDWCAEIVYEGTPVAVIQRRLEGQNYDAWCARNQRGA